jgi:CubicO group peptidase (beta-lactamase class C family)
MAAGGVPGLAIGIIREGKTVGTIAEGVRNTASGIPVDAETVFEAASLTKPVFAYAVLQLIDAGALALDDPLCTYVPEYLPDDPQATAITVRSVLSHTTGLPNWRSEANPLRTYFVPSARFSYSGEGFVWLQRVVERVTGDPLEAVMDRLVLGPLGMNRSGLIWRPAFDKNYADPHDAALVVREKSKPIEAKSASTLHTTASDYALFLRAVLSGLVRGPGTRLAGPANRAQAAMRSMPWPASRRGSASGLGIGLGPGARGWNILPMGRQRHVQGLCDRVTARPYGSRGPDERRSRHVDYARIDRSFYPRRTRVALVAGVSALRCRTEMSVYQRELDRRRYGLRRIPHLYCIPGRANC